MIAIAKTHKRSLCVCLTLVILFLSFFSTRAISQTVTPWMTTGDQTTLLQQQANVSFGTNITPTSATVTLTTGTTYQSMEGFGWMMTEGSAELITSLASTQQNALLNELFNPTTGLSGSIVRIGIGATDLSSSEYSYDGTAVDVNMNNFSLSGPDLTYLVPVLQKILAINPNIKILATPWSPPIWMKSNNAWVGGSLQTQYYAAYALYFVKYFQAMKALGINIWGITPQNEPENPNNDPSMSMASSEETNFINQQLGPQMASAGFGSIKIIAYDHNCDDTNYPTFVCNNSSYVDGSAFHLYAGSISALTTVYSATNKNVYFTEQFTGSPTNFSGDFGWHIQNVVIGSANNWSKTAIDWNVASSPSLGPHTPGGCTSCLGAYTVNSSTSYTRNVQYYIIGQISKFVKAGALRFSTSSNNTSVVCAGFRNPDNSIALLVYNAATTSTTVRVISGSAAFDYTIPAASAVTFNWTTGAPVAVTGVSVSPTSASVAVNSTTQLTATIAPANATNTNVTWSSSNASVASVSSTGLVTGVAAGTATITVTTQDGGKTATSAITVTVVATTGVTVSPTTASIYPNQTQQLTATVSPSNASNTNVTWTSSNTAAATVSTSGLVTGVAPGTATITVKTVSGNFTATSAITVNGEQPYLGSPVGLPGIIQAENYNLGGQGVAYNDSDPTNDGGAYRPNEGVDIAQISGTSGYTVGWTVDGEWMDYTVNVTAGTYSFLATVASPNSGEQMIVKLDGVTLTTINIPNTGSYSTFQVVTVANIAFTGGNNKILRLQIVGGSYNIDQVEVRNVATIPVTGVTVSPTTASIVIGSTTQLTATVSPANATNTNVTWSSSNTSVATVSTTGLVTAVAAGTATVTVTTQDGGKTATSAITVTPVAVTGVTVSPTSATVSIGSTQQLTATVTPANATNKTVTWSSSSTAIATVSTTGLVTGVAAGTATITVTTQDGGKTATSVITVSTSAFPGYYNILSRNSGKGLDVTNNSTTSGTQIQQWDVTNGGGSNQRWKFADAGGGNYNIIVKSTQMCLAPSATGTVNGEKVQQRTCTSGNEFKWTVTSLGGGYYKIINLNSGKSLDVQDVSTANGANIQVWDYTGGNNQQWQFVQVETTSLQAIKKVQHSAIPVDDGTDGTAAATIIYPNPAKSSFKVAIKEAGKSTIELYTIDGKLLRQLPVTNGSNIDISTLQQGIYLVKIITEKGTYNKKIIKY